MTDYKWIASFKEHAQIRVGVLLTIAQEWDRELVECDEVDADRDAANKMRLWQCLDRHVESPIEYRMAAQIAVGSDGYNYLLSPYTQPFNDFYTMVTPQAEIGKYRVDFLFRTVLGSQQWLLIVECDGHDYHERTKEQAKRDKKRDRFFQASGYKVLRFTGSEIHADAERCMEEITSLISNDIESALSQMRKG